MARKKPGLGRGLDALLSAATSRPDTVADPSALKHIAIDLIQRGKYQPRLHIRQEGLEELAESIRAQGVVQPIVIRPIESGLYELIAGERRWRASQIAGLHEIPAVIQDIPDQSAAAIALIENIQREDLNPLEEAQALQRLIDEFSITHQQAAESVGRSRASVSNLLRLLELEEACKSMLDEGQLEMGHARALLALSGDTQIQAARQIINKGLSVRETERLIKQIKNQGGQETKKAERSPDVVRLEGRISDQLGAPVQIRYNSAGKGQIMISYNNLDELDGILEHIK
ncbi:MAG TPA: ParB/RepB/Spo0J family partition protein [Gammaproteobacteria bacterium]|nr:ParB/RepB/Spo0J family partition protein [Gammaproteobacteria bacterium]